MRILDLYLGMREIEDSDGGWNGGDTVEFVASWLGAFGLDIDSPVVG